MNGKRELCRVVDDALEYYVGKWKPIILLILFKIRRNEIQ